MRTRNRAETRGNKQYMRSIEAQAKALRIQEKEEVRRRKSEEKDKRLMEKAKRREERERSGGKK